MDPLSFRTFVGKPVNFWSKPYGEAQETGNPNLNDRISEGSPRGSDELDGPVRRTPWSRGCGAPILLGEVVKKLLMTYGSRTRHSSLLHYANLEPARTSALSPIDHNIRE
jgi:hypothetical protein